MSSQVSFINSPLNKSNPTDRAKRAQETATFVTQNYPPVAKLTEIWVAFVEQETRFVFVTTTQSIDVLGFDKKAHPFQRDEEDDSPDEGSSSVDVATSGFQPSAVYVPHSDQTDISIPTLQLEGTLDEGLALAPRFSVTGDATSGFRRPQPPQFVSFDFASYSPASMFPGAITIGLVANDKVVFAKKEGFSTNKLTDGTFSEFLLMKVPYPKFKQFVAGPEATIRVGEKEYELTEGQLAGLHEMTKYVAE